jgi:hypothetical protein
MRHVLPVALMGLLSTSMPALAQSISGPAPLPPAPPVVRTTVTAEELVHLRANGLGDEVLVALIESQGAVFQLAATDLLALRQRGLSDRVLASMLRGGRAAPLSPETVTPRAVPPMPIEQLEAVVPGGSARRADDGDSGEQTDRQSTVVNVSQSVNNVIEQPERYYNAVAVPVAVPVYGGRVDRDDRLRNGNYSPEYWGFGGQRRTDSWDPPHRVSSKPDSKPDLKPDPKPEARPTPRDTSAADAKPTTRAGGRGGQ